jgi:hypothetical protein
MEVRIVPKKGGGWRVDVLNEDLWQTNFKFLINRRN